MVSMLHFDEMIVKIRNKKIENLILPLKKSKEAEKLTAKLV